MEERFLSVSTAESSIAAFSHCFRYLCFVRNAFAGTPTLAKEIMSEADIRAGVATSDIPWDSPPSIVIAANFPIGTKSPR